MCVCDWDLLAILSIICVLLIKLFFPGCAVLVKIGRQANMLKTTITKKSAK